MTQTTTPVQPISLLRLPAVLQRRGRQKSQHAEDVRDGVFTKPIKPSSRLALWPAHEVDQLVAAEVAGATPDQVRDLVKKLEAQRAAALPNLLAA